MFDVYSNRPVFLEGLAVPDVQNFLPTEQILNFVTCDASVSSTMLNLCSPDSLPSPGNAAPENIASGAKPSGDVPPGVELHKEANIESLANIEVFDSARVNVVVKKFNAYLNEMGEYFLDDKLHKFLFNRDKPALDKERLKLVELPGAKEWYREFSVLWVLVLIEQTKRDYYTNRDIIHQDLSLLFQKDVAKLQMNLLENLAFVEARPEIKYYHSKETEDPKNLLGQYWADKLLAYWTERQPGVVVQPCDFLVDSFVQDSLFQNKFDTIIRKLNILDPTSKTSATFRVKFCENCMRRLATSIEPNSSNKQELLSTTRETLQYFRDILKSKAFEADKEEPAKYDEQLQTVLCTIMGYFDERCLDERIGLGERFIIAGEVAGLLADYFTANQAGQAAEELANAMFNPNAPENAPVPENPLWRQRMGSALKGLKVMAFIAGVYYFTKGFIEFGKLTVLHKIELITVAVKTALEFCPLLVATAARFVHFLAGLRWRILDAIGRIIRWVASPFVRLAGAFRNCFDKLFPAAANVQWIPAACALLTVALGVLYTYEGFSIWEEGNKTAAIFGLINGVTTILAGSILFLVAIGVWAWTGPLFAAVVALFVVGFVAKLLCDYFNPPDKVLTDFLDQQPWRYRIKTDAVSFKDEIGEKGTGVISLSIKFTFIPLGILALFPGLPSDTFHALSMCGSGSSNIIFPKNDGSSPLGSSPLVFEVTNVGKGLFVLQSKEGKLATSNNTVTLVSKLDNQQDALWRIFEESSSNTFGLMNYYGQVISVTGGDVGVCPVLSNSFESRSKFTFDFF